MKPPREPPTTTLPSAWTIIGRRFSTLLKIRFSPAVPTWAPVPLKLVSSWPSASAVAGTMRATQAIARVNAQARQRRRRLSRVRHDFSWSRKLIWGAAPSVAGAALAPPIRGVYHSRTRDWASTLRSSRSPEGARPRGDCARALPARGLAADVHEAMRRSRAGSPRACRRRARARRSRGRRERWLASTARSSSGQIPALVALGAEALRRAAPRRAPRPGCAARADRSRGRRAGRDRPGSGCTCAGPRRIITMGACDALGQVLAERLAGASRAPVERAPRGSCPRSRPPPAGAPASSASVGARSSCETGLATRGAAPGPGRARSAARARSPRGTTSCTRARARPAARRGRR